MASKPSSSRDKVRAHRAKLRAQGLRPVQIWLPDTRSEAFKAEARRQSKLVAEADARDPGLRDFMDAMADELFADIETAEQAAGVAPPAVQSPPKRKR